MDGEAAWLTRLLIWTALFLQLQGDRVELGRQIREIQFFSKKANTERKIKENGGEDEAQTTTGIRHKTYNWKHRWENLVALHCPLTAGQSQCGISVHRNLWGHFNIILALKQKLDSRTHLATALPPAQSRSTLKASFKPCSCQLQTAAVCNLETTKSICFSRGCFSYFGVQWIPTMCFK